MNNKLSHIKSPEKIPRYNGPSTTHSNINTLLVNGSNYSKKEVAQLIKDGKVFIKIKNGLRKLRAEEELYIEEPAKNIASINI